MADEHDDTQDDTTPALTREDVTRMINGALRTHGKRQNDDLAKMLDEKLSSFKPPEPDPTPADPAPPDGKPSPELEALKRRLDASEKAREEEKRLRVEESDRQKRAEERQVIMDGLRKHGVSDTKAKALAIMLHSEDRKVRRNEDGEIVFATGDEYDPEVSVETGLASFFQTDAGKEWLPPTGSGGSGAKPGRPGKARRREGPVSAEEAGAELEALLS